MKIKTSELTGAALDWAVAKCEGRCTDIWEVDGAPTWNGEYNTEYHYSTRWHSGGPIIEREKIETWWVILGSNGEGYWQAANLLTDTYGYIGPTALIAAMRCFVASKLGDTVEVPEELL